VPQAGVVPSSFSDPERLLVLVVIAILAGGLLWRALQHRSLLRRWSSDPLLSSSAPRRPGPLRHLSALLLLASLAAMTAGWAGPLAEEEVERERATVVLAIDTSASMLAQDVAPDRFTAAKQAATDFVADLPDGFDVALVGFAGTASVIVPATRDTDEVTRAIDRLQVAGGTALGDAVLTSLSAAAARPEGVPAVIVLLADGGSTAGTPVELAVAAAQEAEVPVTTIAYGTPEGVVVADGRRFEVPVDEAALAEVSEPTGGAAYTAATADQLSEVYDSIRGRLATTVEQVDVSSRLAGLALLLLAGAAVPMLLARLTPA
jgi:Ca-activated chloride channel family protein